MLTNTTLLLPVIGALLLFAPFTLVFGRPVSIFGVPLLVVYLFGVWLALIVGAFFLARRLPRE